MPGQLELSRSTVAVVGAGGIGSTALMYLAGAGVGHIKVVDNDTVDSSNLHRQVLYCTVLSDYTVQFAMCMGRLIDRIGSCCTSSLVLVILTLTLTLTLTITPV